MRLLQDLAAFQVSLTSSCALSLPLACAPSPSLPPPLPPTLPFTLSLLEVLGSIEVSLCMELEMIVESRAYLSFE